MLNSLSEKYSKKAFLTGKKSRSQRVTKCSMLIKFTNRELIRVVHCKLSNSNFPCWILFSPKIISEKVCLSPLPPHIRASRKKKHTETYKVCSESSPMNNEKYCLAKNSVHSEESIRTRKIAAVYPTYKLLSNNTLTRTHTQSVPYFCRKIFWFTMFCSLIKLEFFLYMQHSVFLSFSLRRTCKWNINCINNTHRQFHSFIMYSLGRRLSFSVKTTWSKYQFRVCVCVFVEPNESRIVVYVRRQANARTRTHAYAIN